MGLRTAVLLIVVLLIAALAALNWGTIATPTLISIGFMQVTAPLGLIMLGLTALLGIFFVAYVVYLQSSILMETRRHTKEMQAQRDLADKAEASRFTELRSFLETQENVHMARNAERHAALLARIEQVEAAARQRAEQSENSIAAHIGQLEDRLERRPVATPSAMPPAV
ncbi:MULTISPECIES: LapA family protein [Variovorax]|jgi:mannitol-specific phosphotransferase system IIBC component|uniref:LapA family protein n=1 Tax=Variovorax ginsengisoli TaxID=363844 RepID=A0ABT8S7Y4_9BURK|nr:MULTISPECIES: LapA family protein [Variovorax]MDM0080038.1 LapA family protein [Variovorax sp. J31P179]MDN8615418.1 LapA family protein [Variovorax ginsengisoli]MDO1534588.1 LapA family protein [Variovorax ginsengisoli]HET7835821.1 LapA family protein [Variovorax sp.]